MNIQVVLEPAWDGWYTASVPALPGCVSEGASKWEAIQNIREAIELHLEPIDDDIALSSDKETLNIALW